MPALIILLLVLLLPVVFVIVQYNWLVSLRNYISESWSNVDTELKRRYDLIPNLVATVKGYAAHESEVLARVTELRQRCVANNGSPADQARDETQLVAALKQMLVVVESYPQLKADQQFLRLSSHRQEGLHHLPDHRWQQRQRAPGPRARFAGYPGHRRPGPARPPPFLS